mmetsp:Transcript_24288/g.62625  ORF Transcript_24288/g.62625 Transcript_24288/m.62625 type:complete len:217 (+) Transcript_24288:1179-1829(+)
MMYTSELRTFSCSWIATSPSLKLPILTGMRGTPRRAEISCASSGFAVPATSFISGVKPWPVRGGFLFLNSSMRVSSRGPVKTSWSSRRSNSGPSSRPVPSSPHTLSYFFMILKKPCLLIHTYVVILPRSLKAVQYSSWATCGTTRGPPSDSTSEILVVSEGPSGLYPCTIASNRSHLCTNASFTLSSSASSSGKNSASSASLSKFVRCPSSVLSPL